MRIPCSYTPQNVCFPRNEDSGPRCESESRCFFRVRQKLTRISLSLFVFEAPHPPPLCTPPESTARIMGSTGPKNMCLTMHQPWASLLVAGVKRVEGRSWHTDHRGKLWIHAAAKEPGAEEVRGDVVQGKQMCLVFRMVGIAHVPKTTWNR